MHSLNSRLKKVRVFSPPHRLSWVSNRAPFSCESRSKPVSTAKNRPFFSDTRDSGRCTASLGFRGPGHGFGFFKDADSHVAPPFYPGTAVGASDETVICRMVWDLATPGGRWARGDPAGRVFSPSNSFRIGEVLRNRISLENN